MNSLQNRCILFERALNIPSSVYKPPSCIWKTLEAWGEWKRTAKGEGVRQKGTPFHAPFLALFHLSQLSTFCESKMVAKHSVSKPSSLQTACIAGYNNEKYKYEREDELNPALWWTGYLCVSTACSKSSKIVDNISIVFVCIRPLQESKGCHESSWGVRCWNLQSVVHWQQSHAQQWWRCYHILRSIAGAILFSTSWLVVVYLQGRCQ